jgi:hypothetical protein
MLYIQQIWTSQYKNMSLTKRNEKMSQLAAANPTLAMCVLADMRQMGHEERYCLSARELGF